MELEKGVQRWIVDISKWNPSPDYFASVMSFLPQHEHSPITRSVPKIYFEVPFSYFISFAHVFFQMSCLECVCCNCIHFYDHPID